MNRKSLNPFLGNDWRSTVFIRSTINNGNDHYLNEINLMVMIKNYVSLGIIVLSLIPENDRGYLNLAPNYCDLCAVKS